MLTRLKVSGFKNLVDVEIRFGPLTCITGLNGVGKSNLFDALTFLSALADKPLIEAALTVRRGDGKQPDIRDLFHHIGAVDAEEMAFEAELIVPGASVDDMGQPATTSSTLLRYTLRLAYRAGDSVRSVSALRILEETLIALPTGDARGDAEGRPEALALFPHRPRWSHSALHGRRRGTPGETALLSTDAVTGTIMLHREGGGARPLRTLVAAALPRTVLSTTTAASPTALIARNELRAWRCFQWDPSALRTPDPFTAPAHLGSHGEHLPSTLYRLTHPIALTSAAPVGADTAAVVSRTYQRDTPGNTQESNSSTRIAQRLNTFLGDVDAIWVDRDVRRERLTVVVSDHQQTAHAARALSAGTLRFLALTVLECDGDAAGVVCLEEPESGIHPSRLPAVLQLLRNLAVDVDAPVSPDNPLRQVIFTTHSPVIVSALRRDEVLVAEVSDTGDAGKGVTFT